MVKNIDLTQKNPHSLNCRTFPMILTIKLTDLRDRVDSNSVYTHVEYHHQRLLQRTSSVF